VKRSPISHKSSKRRKDDALRKTLIVGYLQLHPDCEIGIDGICQGRSTEVDEVIGRGVLPGAQLRPELFQALCRGCHRWKTDNPDWAYRHGWSAHAWDLDRIEKIRRQRVTCFRDCTLNHIVIDGEDGDDSCS
jgi:hypothetical protein